MKIREIVTEARTSFLNYAQEKFPNMPPYVVYELIYKNSKRDPRNIQEIWLAFYGSLKWEFDPQFKVTMDTFDDSSMGFLTRNLSADSDDPKHKARFDKQREMIKQQGISKEPIIVGPSEDEPGKITLLEGYHRTTEALRAYPEGYTCPAWVGSSTARSQTVAKAVPPSFWQKIKALVTKS